MGKNNGAKAAQALAVKPSNEAQVKRTISILDDVFTNVS